jgi:hypothetical protein
VRRAACTLSLLALLVAACATTPPAPPAARSAFSALSGPDPSPFSLAAAGAILPVGWKPVRLMRLKRLTEFRLVEDDGGTAMLADANASASGLQYETSADLREFPWLKWRWKVPKSIENANNTLHHVEDSPARVIVTFEGSREDLPAFEQMNYDLALAITGNRMPYATLMYVWENTLPEGAIISHHMTSRVKMVVAGNTPGKPGAWHDEMHNVLEDYRRAFGEEPPRVKTVGIMSDSDNTGAHVTAYFGDIRFLRGK